MDPAPTRQFQPYLRRGWDSLPHELLARVVVLLSDTWESTSSTSAVRSTCRQWRDSFDKNLSHLQLRCWPTSHPAAGVLGRKFTSVRSVDLRACCLQHDAYSDSRGLYSSVPGDHSRMVGSSSKQRDCCESIKSPSVAEGWSLAPQHLQHSVKQQPMSGVSIQEQACLQQPTAVKLLTCRYPAALPHGNPVAGYFMWQDLQHMHALQHLAISGSMLLVRSVRSSIQQPNSAADDPCGLSTPTRITHVYTLHLPAAVCQLKHLRSLTVEWRLPQPSGTNSGCTDGCLDPTGSLGQVVHSSSNSSSNSPTRCRRRSYESSLSPVIIHVADPVLHLPPQLNNLSSLLQLSLAASFSDPAALQPLLGLSRLEVLSLGPGELDIRALVPLAHAGVLQGLKQLVLLQQGRWDAAALVDVLGCLQQLQQLEVGEFEVLRLSTEDAVPAEQHLTPDHMTAVAATLQAVRWTTCSQRITQGSSILGNFVGAATGAAAAPWVGGCSELRHLRLTGCAGVVETGNSMLTGAVSTRPRVLSAPVLEQLSTNISECRALEVLEVHGLGVPLLPNTLYQLTQLHTVSIASSRVARRAFHAAHVALAILGSCKGLRDLTLAGCELRSIPGWLPGLSGLTSLNLQGNYLQDLPGCAPGLGLPPGLQVLNLSDNRLREIPDSLGDLICLQQLVLDENYLCSLPQQVWLLPQLRELSIRENMLPLLPDVPGVSRGSGSHQLMICDSNSSSSFSSSNEPWCTVNVHPAAAVGAGSQRKPPKTAANTPSAAGLAAGTAESTTRNSSSSIRGRLQSKLKVLDVSHNQLSQLPDGMSMLTSLQQLSLGHNQLRSLPASSGIWALTRMTALCLSHNQISKLPAGLAKLQHLVELDLSGNFLPTQSEVPAAAAASADDSPVSSPRCATPLAATAAAAAAATIASPTPQSPKCSRRLTAADQQQLPSPLRALRHLQQLRMGGQQQQHQGGHQCPLQLLFGGLVELIELVRSLAPPHHQCPVTRAAAAAVAHLGRMSTGRVGKRERERQLAERVRYEPGWVLLPAPKAQPAAAGDVGGV